MDDDNLLLKIFLENLFFYIMWHVHVLSSGGSTLWVCRYMYPTQYMHLDLVSAVSCHTGDALLIFGHLLGLALVSIIIFCWLDFVRTACLRYSACSQTVHKEDDGDGPKAAVHAVTQALLLYMMGARRYVIQDRSVGHTYEKIFVDYINVFLNDLTIEDPYLRKPHQVGQLKELLRVFTRHAPNLKRVNIVANWANKKDLLAIKAWLKNSFGIVLTFKFENALHDRWLRLNNGFDVSMGRGLDIYYTRSGLWEDRECKGCTFSFFPAKKFVFYRAIRAFYSNTD